MTEWSFFCRARKSYLVVLVMEMRDHKLAAFSKGNSSKDALDWKTTERRFFKRRPNGVFSELVFLVIKEKMELSRRSMNTAHLSCH